MRPLTTPTHTDDSLFAGKLRCRQHRRGYRFSIDALLLAHFGAPTGKERRILDLCAGCGVVALILAYRHPDLQLSALEIQPQLAELIRHNACDNGFSERIKVLEGNCQQIDTLLPAGSFDRVLANPPYRKAASGRLNLNPEQRLARHEISADIGTVAKAASFALKTRGRAAFVYPASRAATLFAALAENQLAAKRLQMVHSYPGGPGKLILLEAVKNGGEGLHLMPPFFVYRKIAAESTPEMTNLLNG